MGAGAAGGSVFLSCCRIFAFELGRGGPSWQPQCLIMPCSHPLSSLLDFPVLVPAAFFRFTMKSDPGADCLVSFHFSPWERPALHVGSLMAMGLLWDVPVREKDKL